MPFAFDWYSSISLVHCLIDIALNLVHCTLFDLKHFSLNCCEQNRILDIISLLPWQQTLYKVQLWFAYERLLLCANRGNLSESKSAHLIASSLLNQIYFSDFLYFALISSYKETLINCIILCMWKCCSTLASHVC